MHHNRDVRARTWHAGSPKGSIRSRGSYGNCGCVPCGLVAPGVNPCGVDTRGNHGSTGSPLASTGSAPQSAAAGGLSGRRGGTSCQGGGTSCRRGEAARRGVQDTLWLGSAHGVLAITRPPAQDRGQTRARFDHHTGP